LDAILAALPARFPDKDLRHETAFFKGESALGKKELSQAVENYSAAIQAKADGAYAPQAYLGLGIAYAAMNDAANADKNLNEALRFDQDIRVTMRARFEMANLRLKAGDLENAAKGFMMVAILYDDPKYTPPALYKAGECFASLNKIVESRKAFAELANRYPDSEWAKKAIAGGAVNG
jgi:TolA-binding protein